jgi:hypothetical protein
VNEFLQVEIYVANKVELARNALLLLALSSSMPHVPLERKHPDEQNSKGHLHVFYKMAYFILEKWWYYNVCVKVTAYNSSMDVDSLINKIHDQIEPKLVNNLAEYIPAIKRVLVFSSGEIPPPEPFPGKIEVGEELIIRVESEPNPNLEQENLRLEFFLNGENLCLVKEAIVKVAAITTFELTFEGRNPGTARVQLVLTDRKTLLCSRAWEVSINVLQKKQPDKPTGKEKQ